MTDCVAQIKDLPPAALRAWLAARGHDDFRADQIERWLFTHWCTHFADMRNLPGPLRRELEAAFLPFALECVAAISGQEKTRKFLFALPDRETIETVLITAPHRTTVCISTQVGCPVRCVFCASGREGLVRDLTPGEIIDQVVYVCRELGARVDNIVVMGMGEPLLNLDNVVTALDALCDRARFGLGARRVTISTSGIVPGILRLAELGRQWQLALSLHAVSDMARARLIPERHRYPLPAVLEACAVYRRRTGRMVTLEYVVIAGANDGDPDAVELARIARQLRAKVNLIPCNPVGGGAHRAPPSPGLERFFAALQSAGVRVTVRRRKGADIDAACGQLRRRAAALNAARGTEPAQPGRPSSPAPGLS